MMHACRICFKLSLKQIKQIGKLSLQLYYLTIVLLHHFFQRTCENVTFLIISLKFDQKKFYLIKTLLEI